MSFFEKVRQARATLTAPESTATLDYMEDFFGNGANWTKGVYSAADGARCLVGAAEHAKVSKVDDAKYWLRQAIAERSPHWTIEQFNDHAADYGEIAAVIRRAKELAQAAQMPAVRQALPAPVVAEVLPPAPAQVPARMPAPRPAPVVAYVPPAPMPVRSPAPPPAPVVALPPPPASPPVRMPAPQPTWPPAGANRGRRNLFWELLSD